MPASPAIAVSLPVAGLLSAQRAPALCRAQSRARSADQSGPAICPFPVCRLGLWPGSLASSDPPAANPGHLALGLPGPRGPAEAPGIATKHSQCPSHWHIHARGPSCHQWGPGHQLPLTAPSSSRPLTYFLSAPGGLVYGDSCLHIRPGLLPTQSATRLGTRASWVGRPHGLQESRPLPSPLCRRGLQRPLVEADGLEGMSGAPGGRAPGG